MSAGFADHFSVAADGYAAYRPAYPAALFDFLAAEAPARASAWDCGTGSGQAACALARRFERVLASDASAAQVARAAPHERVGYVVAAAERAPLAAGSVDLVTVAQALHWFDRARFFEEVRRVARPGALVAAWTYSWGSVDPAVDAVVLRLRERVEADWPPGRELVHASYRGVRLPFEPVPGPALELTAEWTVDRLIGYLGTWSSVNRYRARTRQDPVAALADELRAVWPEGERRVQRWPLTVLAGRVSGGAGGAGARPGR